MQGIIEKLPINTEVWYLTNKGRDVNKAIVYGYVNNKVIRIKHGGSHSTIGIEKIYFTKEEAQKHLKEKCLMFKDLLQKANLTQTKLGEMIGRSQNIISKWCVGGCEPQIKDLLNLKEALKVDLETLLQSFVNQKQNKNQKSN